jgi:hypothetical protein
MIEGLEKKDADIDFNVNELLKKKDLISEYLTALELKHQVYVENCFKVLNKISEKHPDFLYPHWDFFVNHMGSENNYHITEAIIILANLTSVDKEDKFKIIFDEFFDFLRSNKTIVPMYLLKYSSRIVIFKPDFEDRITNILLNIEKIHPGKQIELVKSAVIESFSEFFKESKNKNKIINFVKEQLNSPSPKTKKTARAFLNKYMEK